MADEVAEIVPQDTIQTELASQMAISLGGGLQVEPQQSEVTETKDEPIVNEPTPFSFDTLKEKYGYEKPDDVLAEIEEARKIKANPTPSQLKFENEESERLLKAWAGGKKAEVLQYLQEQDKIEKLSSSEVNKDVAGDIIKLGMQLKYKDLTAQEIEYKFNKQFALPKKPVQTADELDEEFAERESSWREQVEDIEMSKIIEAKLAKPEIEAQKGKLVVPKLEEAIDEGYVQYKKALEERPKIDAETKEAYKAFVPKAIGIKTNFKDEANKIDFNFEFEPDAESFSKAVEMVTDQTLFYKDYVKSDGTPDRQKFLSDMYFAKNRDKIIMEAMKQAKNATIKSLLPDNSTGGLLRQMPQGQEMSELDMMMQASLRGY